MTSYDICTMTNSSLIYPDPLKKCSGVEDIPCHNQPSHPPHVIINLDANNPEIEDFDHIDELIMYFVSFLRRLRWTYISSKKNSKLVDKL
ncbi:hypothetical protein TNIN_422441 [Trichonephila inaurata madagascariensis]|uniref:Uncharacterized protein n=1 Tax=Trichonephila inaurata madagascariensis TaxID=2747483 RepID=A0A8X6YCN7_9ARAC|nr:hypothetical protein TNIN_422441 [Trichonephila inaurata madagascariensis]